MALVALSRYNDDTAKSLISDAVDSLRTAWLESDALNNANTLSTVISALCAVDEDIFSPQWQKEERTLFDTLCEVKLDNGSFKYLA